MNELVCSGTASAMEDLRRNALECGFVVPGQHSETDQGCGGLSEQQLATAERTIEHQAKEIEQLKAELVRQRVKPSS